MIVKNNIAIRIAGKVSRYVDASMTRATPTAERVRSVGGGSATVAPPGTRLRKLHPANIGGCEKFSDLQNRPDVLLIGAVAKGIYSRGSTRIISQRTGGGTGIAKLPQAAQQAAGGRGRGGGGGKGRAVNPAAG